MTLSRLWYERGLREGDRQQAAIAFNLARFRSVAEHHGIRFSALQDAAVESQTRGFANAARKEYSASRRLGGEAGAQLRGFADAARVPFVDLLAYNLFSEAVEPGACSVAMVLPDATADGAMLFLKNSDKQGSPQGNPQQWHLNKEINVVRIEEPDPDAGTNRVIGVTAAGQIIFKMGLNDRGLAAGASLGRIKKASDKTASYWLAAGRGELMREGLLHEASARTAAARSLPQLLTNPVSSPGNVQFCDPSLAVNLECSFDELAAEWLKQGFLVRTNCFNLMAGLNREDDVSSPTRRDYGMRFLAERAGRITVQDLQALSADHTNGPSLSSVCRHSEDWQEETSLSSAVMRVVPGQPEASEIWLALGKPCHAWPSAEGEGWIRLSVQATEADVPAPFLTGEAFKRFYSEQPNRVAVT